MQLSFRQFQVGDFAEYKAWFADPELERWLGPLDDEWLAAVLSKRAADGATRLVLDGNAFVAVVETSLHPENESLAAVTGLAVNPDLRGQGIGKAVLREVLALHRREGRLEHLAYIREDNETARRCFERSGFVPVTLTPNGEGFLEFRLAEEMMVETP